MVRAKVIESSVISAPKRLKRWLKKKKFAKDDIISVTQTPHRLKFMRHKDRVLITVLYRKP